jgi:hypothetical protein
MKRHLKPLPPDEDYSFDHWIQGTNYPAWRKDELRRIKSDPNHLKLDHEGKFKGAGVKSFVKYESYPEYKHARVINSRDDSFKVEIGPYFHAIEKAIFKLPWFIKYVPVEQRPDYVMNRLGQIKIGNYCDGVVEGDDGLFQVNGDYFVTDHSQYEAAFTKCVMEDCEEPLYEYMLSLNPMALHAFRFYYSHVKGRNICKFRNFTMSCLAKRMSGEMNTSLGNGWANLMSFMFECHRTGNKPTAQGLALNGFTVKINKVESINKSSFCGFMFDETDRITVKNPMDFIIQFGWLPEKYIGSKDNVLMGLYRCKAISLLHSFQSSPIVDAFARYVLRMTQDYEVRQYYNDNYMYARVITALKRFNDGLLVRKEIPINTRRLVEQVFNIAIPNQITMERYFDDLQTLEPIDHPLLNMMAPSVNFFHHLNYTMPFEYGKQNNYPVLGLQIVPVRRNTDTLISFRTKLRPRLHSIEVLQGIKRRLIQ